MSPLPLITGRRLPPARLALALLLAATLCFGQTLLGQAQSEEVPAALPELDLKASLGSLRVTRAGDEYRIVLKNSSAAITPQQLAQALYESEQEQGRHSWLISKLYVIFNISTAFGLIWVGVGFFGQLLFTFRMVLQWLASEKHKRSVVPVGFWWGSLIGGLMLLIYFCWRKDPVGILGQATGSIIYVRNLVLIYRPGAKPGPTPGIGSDPAPEPELADR